MRELTPEERQKIIDINNLAAANWSRIKESGEFVALAPTVASGKESASVAFSAGDTGNDSGLLPELAPERAEFQIGEIKRLTIRESVKATIKQYLESRNKAIRAGKKNAKPNVSRPFEFTQHSYKG